MPVIDVETTVVQVAADEDGAPAGAFATIEDLTSYSGDHGSEEATRVRVFGKADPHVRGGEKTDEYSLDGLYNPADTNGQNVLKASYENDVPCWLRVLPDGEAGYTQKVRVTAYTDEAEADGDFVRVSFTAERDGARVDYPEES